MDPKMRQGSRLKALGDIEELMAEGEHERAKPMFAPKESAEPMAEEMGESPGAELAEGAPPEEAPDASGELTPEDVSKLKALLDLMQ